ncbi:hypothetical protein DSM104443_03963 [Usitatibacter rugosus]|uniref:YCII-related domain-containing protein n=1 Tax=Usitatibacter rugosus TaxID=2732067 RepID=A0A6M4H036_9PROT|nr:YciI family protein [Usitatibacter rugosus]QJR12869.1 hypothetical protein DSM104443_03963 [Usitatibacter rugosus]
MRYMSIYRAAESTAPPSAEDMAKMGAFNERMTRSGVLIATGGCLPSSLGARVRAASGKVSVTDGPFVETKEVTAGFAIIECESKAQAIQLAKEFLAVAGGDGECEVREMFTGGDCGHAD